ncbi:hypothetical protein GCM10023185_17560 [Hymenobacter saemangeumensis]|uniref:PDZ domain-containing protein n=1 Tax=Hymenobacter saemangeumensis TaxID=1084522 RepID=A0ABP8IAU8_9BACT
MSFLRFACSLLWLWSCCLPAVAQSGSTFFVFEKPKQKKARLYFQSQRNLIVVSAHLNGAGPFNFLLDTGVSTSLITDARLADSLRLARGQLFRVVGAGGEATGLQAYQTTNVRLTMPGVVAPAMSLLVLSEDVLNLSGYVGMPIHGILGSELFQSFVVSLQPHTGQLHLYDPESFVAPSGKQWAALPLSLEGGKAYLTAPVMISDSLTLPLKLVLDTGAGHALSIETDSDPRLRLPARRITAELGRGITGVVRGHLGRTPVLQLGRHTLRSVLTSFPVAADVHSRVTTPRNGNIGFELLKRFSLIIDYPHQRMLLRPNAQFNEPFEHDMCGLDLLATGPDLRRYVVLGVVPGSPAAQAGLLADDELVGVNLVPAHFFTLTQLSRLLHSEDGRALYMVLRRPNGELYTTIVRLKRQI